MREYSYTSAAALCLRGILYGELHNRQELRLFYYYATVSGKELNFLVVYYIVTKFITDTCLK